MTERVMVDIETLGREPGCVVVSIGAVEFGYGIKDELDLDVAPTSCQRAGLDIDAETLAWWLTQGEAARSQLLGGQPLAEALDELQQRDTNSMVAQRYERLLGFGEFRE